MLRGRGAGVGVFIGGGEVGKGRGVDVSVGMEVTIFGVIGGGTGVDWQADRISRNVKINRLRCTLPKPVLQQWSYHRAGGCY